MDGRFLLVLVLCCAPVFADQWTWDFNGDLAARGGAGAALTPSGTYTFESATIGGGSARVARYLGGVGPATDAYFTVTNPVGGNGGGRMTNVFTLIFDIRLPVAAWTSLYQASVANANDGDSFVHPTGGVGISADYADDGNPLRLTFDAWHRVAVVIDVTQPSGKDDTPYRCYIDGSLQNVVQAPASWGPDGRYSLEGVFHLFADESGETQAEAWVNSFQIRDYAMTDVEIAALAGPDASGIPGAPPDPTIKVGPYLQDARPTSIWILWETDFGSGSHVDFGLTTGLGSTSTGTAYPSDGTAMIHHVQLVGLLPNTTYYYRAITDGEASGLFHFKTPPLPDSDASFRFAAYSDSQTNSGAPGKLEEVINDGIIAFIHDEFSMDLADELAFSICTGDLVDHGMDYGEWADGFFDETQKLNQHVPLYPVLGNHEADSHWYTDYFHLPENGTPGYLEHWYYTDYSNVRLIGLDSNSGYQIQEQLDWLDDVLADACLDEDIDFVFAQLHHPHKSELWLPGEIDYTGDVIVMLEAFTEDCGKPSIHFFGHTHGYSRGQSRDHTHLWVNVASAEGHIDYWGVYPNTDYDEFAVSLPEWGFVLVEVEAGVAPEFRLRRISRGNDVVPMANEVVDDIVIRKVNQAPDQPVTGWIPASGCVVPAGEVTLQASAFADADGDEHIESHLQVTTVAGDYASPVVDEWFRNENWFAPPDATGMADGYYSVNTVVDPDMTKLDVDLLSGGQVYFWRVRYRDAGLAWSLWSQEGSFVTASSGFTENLLINPGAEDGVVGWVVIDPPLESLVDHECNSGTSPHSGLRFFGLGGVCSGESNTGEARQAMDVSAYATLIDEGTLEAYYAGYVKDYSGDDRPEFRLFFLDGGGVTLERSDLLGANTAEWTHHAGLALVPVGTRAVEMRLYGTRNVGGDNDSYFDDLEVRLRVGAVFGDSHGDGTVDLTDYADWQACQTMPEEGSLAPGCDVFDADGDCDVDMADFHQFVHVLGRD